MNDATGSTRRDQERADASRLSLWINLLDVTIVDDRNLIREDRLNAHTLRPEARDAPIEGHLKMLKRRG
jgi:predicted transposase YdaD